MTDITISSNDALDAMKGLGIRGTSGPINTLKGLLGNHEITLNAPDWVGAAKSDADHLAELMTEFGETSFEELKKKLLALKGGVSSSGGGSSSSSALPGGDPLEPMLRIAEAINQAESKLNEQNLIIFDGTVDLDFMMNLAGAVEAKTTLHVNIRPKPFQ